MSTENKHRSIAPSIPYHNKSVLDDKCDGTRSIIGPGADPGFRRGGGGGSYIQKGGGGFRTGISGADPNCCRVLGKSTSKKKLQTAVGGGGGGPITQKTSLYPGMRPTL